MPDLPVSHDLMMHTHPGLGEGRVWAACSCGWASPKYVIPLDRDLALWPQERVSWLGSEHALRALVEAHDQDIKRLKDAMENTAYWLDQSLRGTQGGYHPTIAQMVATLRRVVGETG